MWIGFLIFNRWWICPFISASHDTEHASDGWAINRPYYTACRKEPKTKQKATLWWEIITGRVQLCYKNKRPENRRRFSVCCLHFFPRLLLPRLFLSHARHIRFSDELPMMDLLRVRVVRVRMTVHSAEARPQRKPGANRLHQLIHQDN